MVFDLAWDKSLEHRWKFFLPELVSEIKKAIDRKFKRGSGKLRNSFSLRNVRTNARKDGVVITNELPYAQAQNDGAKIPTRYPVRAKALRFIAKNGDEVFAAKAKGFQLRGKRYIQDAMQHWIKEVGVEWK